MWRRSAEKTGRFKLRHVDMRVFSSVCVSIRHREQERVSAADRKGLWKVHSLHRELATCAEKLKNPSFFFWRQRFKQGARLKYRGRIRRTPQNFLYSLVKVWTKFTSNTELRPVSIIHSCCTFYVQPRTHKDIRRQPLRVFSSLVWRGLSPMTPFREHLLKIYTAKKKKKSMRYQAQSTSNFWESRRRKAYFTSFNVMKSDEIGLVLVPKCTNCKSLWTKHKQTEQFI